MTDMKDESKTLPHSPDNAAESELSDQICYVTIDWYDHQKCEKRRQRRKFANKESAEKWIRGFHCPRVGRFASIDT